MSIARVALLCCLSAMSCATPPRSNTIGFLCGHGELCPFPTGARKIPAELALALEGKPFVKKVVSDITQLEARADEHADLIRKRFETEGFQVARVEGGQPIGDDIGALVVFGPRKALGDVDLFYLDQFLLSGRRVAVFLGNYEVSVNAWDETSPYELVTKATRMETNLDAFLAHFGVRNGNDLVMEPATERHAKINTLSIIATQVGPMPSLFVWRYPLFPAFDVIAASEPVMTGQTRVVLPFVSSVSVASPATKGLTVVPLITSSPQAVVRSSDFVLDPRLLKDAAAADEAAGPVHVALHATGKAVPSFFAGRARPDKGATRRIERGAVDLVVIGSTLGLEDLSSERILDGFSLAKVLENSVEALGAAMPYYIRYANVWGRFIGSQQPIHFGARGKVIEIPGQQTAFALESLGFIYSVMEWTRGGVGPVRPAPK